MDTELNAILRVAARALVDGGTLLSREEAMALLPAGTPEAWLDERMRERVSSGDGIDLLRWSDIVSALTGTAASEASDSPYLNIHEAAAYLRYASVNALRMAISRKHVRPTARRGRTCLFTREDLDRQLRERVKPEVVEPSTATNESSEAGAVATPEMPHEPVAVGRRKRRRYARSRPAVADVGDPYGLSGAMQGALRQNAGHKVPPSS